MRISSPTKVSVPFSLLILAAIVGAFTVGVVFQQHTAYAAYSRDTLLSSSSQQATTAATSNAFVRVVHASPSIGAVDVFANGKVLLTNFNYGTISNYVPVPAGSSTIQIAHAGQGIGQSVLTATVSLSAGIPYTIAAIGIHTFSLATFVDNNQVAGGKAAVRVYQLSQDAGSITAATGGQTFVSGLTYTNASNYFTVAPGSYTFAMTITRKSTITKHPVVNGSLPLTLAANTITSVFAMGLLNEMGVSTAFAFVVAQVPATPGLPSTGSDPMLALNPQTVNVWIFGILLLALVSASTVLVNRRLSR